MRRVSLGSMIATVLMLVTAACGSSSKSSSSGPTVPTSPAPSTSLAPRTTTAPTRGVALGANVALRSVASGLDSPVALAWRAHDARMYVAEQPGRVRIVDTNGRVATQPVLSLTGLSHGNEEGLLGIAFSTDGTKLYTDSTDTQNNTHVDEY